jgi:hypothetical protein
MDERRRAEMASCQKQQFRLVISVDALAYLIFFLSSHFSCCSCILGSLPTTDLDLARASPSDALGEGVHCSGGGVAEPRDEQRESEEGEAKRSVTVRVRG